MSALHFFKKRERKKKRVSFVRVSSLSDHKTPTHDLFFFPFKFFLFFCFCDTELQAARSLFFGHFFFQVMLSDGLVYERAANALFFFPLIFLFLFPGDTERWARVRASCYRQVAAVSLNFSENQPACRTGALYSECSHMRAHICTF
jgi:hypothetical protein